MENLENVAKKVESNNEETWREIWPNLLGAFLNVAGWVGIAWISSYAFYPESPTTKEDHAVQSPTFQTSITPSIRTKSERYKTPINHPCPSGYNCH